MTLVVPVLQVRIVETFGVTNSMEMAKECPVEGLKRELPERDSCSDDVFYHTIEFSVLLRVQVIDIGYDSIILTERVSNGK